jgi:hypothetical protein
MSFCGTTIDGHRSSSQAPAPGHVDEGSLEIVVLGLETVVLDRATVVLDRHADLQCHQQKLILHTSLAGSAHELRRMAQ